MGPPMLKSLQRRARPAHGWFSEPGSVPSISNVIVRALSDMLGGADEINTALLLNAGDISGRASFDYFLQELSMTFVRLVDGEDQPTRAFTDPQLVRFPPPIGAHYAYLFPFFRSGALSPHHVGPYGHHQTGH